MEPGDGNEVPQERVSIHYRRLPDRTTVFEQAVVHRGADHIVTLAERVALPAPVVVQDRAVLEPGADVVWFTYPERWHDIGRFHLADGTFTGIYANVLTPVEIRGSRWNTTDLCLDVWIGADGEPVVLDEDEMEAAVENGWIDPATCARARAEAAALIEAALAGAWPPRHVTEWTLERAHATRRLTPRPGAETQPLSTKEPTR